MSSYALWNSYMRCYDFLSRLDGYRENMRDLVQAMDVWPGTRVLDAGSGTGNLSILLKERHADVTSCDFSESAIVAHKAKDPEAHVVQASLEDRLPFNDRSFDRVCCASVLFALSRTGCQLALSEFARVLSPGGRLVLTVPSAEANLLRLIRMCWKSRRSKQNFCLALLRFITDLPALIKVVYYNDKLRKLPDWQGFHRFNDVELSERVTSAGFENVQITRTYGGVFLLLTASKSERSAD